MWIFLTVQCHNFMGCIRPVIEKTQPEIMRLPVPEKPEFPGGFFENPDRKPTDRYGHEIYP
jgi:hypothetical protein